MADTGVAYIRVELHPEDRAPLENLIDQRVSERLASLGGQLLEAVDHIDIVTRLENVNRSAKRKLSDEDIIAIAESEAPARLTAIEFDVTKRYVYQIRNGYRPKRML